MWTHNPYYVVNPLGINIAAFLYRADRDKYVSEHPGTMTLEQYKGEHRK